MERGENTTPSADGEIPSSQVQGGQAQGNPGLSVQLAPGLRLQNPVMIASGTLGQDGYGGGLADRHPLRELGGVVLKTVTRHRREGNPEPRRFPSSYREGAEGGDHLFLNAIGLMNPGIETLVREWTTRWTQWNATVLLSLAAHSVGDFGEMAALSTEAVGISALELNLSCPNIENGAMFSHSPELTQRAVAAVRANTKLPVLAKLAPNVPDIKKIARAAVDGGADVITICNTLPAMRIDLATKKPVLGNITGGLSGIALRPVSLALVYQASRAVDAPIVGVGGIFTAGHALEYILAGASAVQLGSTNLIDPETPWRILGELQEYMNVQGAHCLDDIRKNIRADDGREAKHIQES